MKGIKLVVLLISVFAVGFFLSPLIKYGAYLESQRRSFWHKQMRLRTMMCEDFKKGISLLRDSQKSEPTRISALLRLMNNHHGLRWTRFAVSKAFEVPGIPVSTFLDWYEKISFKVAFLLPRAESVTNNNLPYATIWEALQQSDCLTQQILAGFAYGCARWYRVGETIRDVKDAARRFGLTQHEAEEKIKEMLERISEIDSRTAARLLTRAAAILASTFKVYERCLAIALKQPPFLFSAYINEGLKCGEPHALLAVLAWLRLREKPVFSAPGPWLGALADPDGDDCLLTALYLLPLSPPRSGEKSQSDLFEEIAQNMRLFLEKNFNRLEWAGRRWKVGARPVRVFPTKVLSSLEELLYNSLKGWDYIGRPILLPEAWQKIASKILNNTYSK